MAKMRSVNWHGEPAAVCWVCGGRNTRKLDHETRECYDCGNTYAIIRVPSNAPQIKPPESAR